VLTVGTLHASNEPTVTIEGVTITGGVTQSAFDTSFETLGGGVYVPEAAWRDAHDSSHRRERDHRHMAAPHSRDRFGDPCGPIDACGFAHAGGGGIDSWGHLTVRDTLVAGNQASGPLTRDADGGGIYSQDGTLTVDHSVITGNRAEAGEPGTPAVVSPRAPGS
jgi:hypothetical protein